MLLFRRPEVDRIARFIADQAGKPFSYSAVGGTRAQAPPGFVVDHNRIRLGESKKTFDAARSAVREWKMFELGWVELFQRDTVIQQGATVAILARVFGLWSLNACRIVYVIDEDGPVRRFGFAYGTLREHAESGEERFTVEWRHEDDSVWYDLLAFSRPNQALARIAYPVARSLQRRFARDSKEAMLKYCRAAGADC